MSTYSDLVFSWLLKNLRTWPELDSRATRLARVMLALKPTNLKHLLYIKKKKEFIAIDRLKVNIDIVKKLRYSLKAYH